jgi:hypothetical protein
MRSRSQQLHASVPVGSASPSSPTAAPVAALHSPKSGEPLLPSHVRPHIHHATKTIKSSSGNQKKNKSRGFLMPASRVNRAITWVLVAAAVVFTLGSVYLMFVATDARLTADIASSKATLLNLHNNLFSTGPKLVGTDGDVDGQQEQEQEAAEAEAEQEGKPAARAAVDTVGYPPGSGTPGVPGGGLHKLNPDAPIAWKAPDDDDDPTLEPIKWGKLVSSLCFQVGQRAPLHPGGVPSEELQQRLDKRLREQALESIDSTASPVGLCRLKQVDPYPITYSLSNP